MYDAAFFDVIRKGCQDSAAVVAPLVHKLVKPNTVIDVGCGEGHWAKAFEGLGCTVTGVDGSGTQSVLDNFVGWDLADPLPVLAVHDLAVSLEVAEHLPPERSDSFIDDLCALAPVVLFSAAIPGQGGTGHCNEQPTSYWVERFEANGYAVSGALRWEIWDNPFVENWYKANTLIAVRKPVPKHLAVWFKGAAAIPFAVVHPVLFDARRR